MLARCTICFPSFVVGTARRREDLARDRRRSRATLLVAKLDGQIVGCLTLAVFRLPTGVPGVDRGTLSSTTRRAATVWARR